MEPVIPKQPADKAAQPASSAGLGSLPEWDLGDLYAGPDSPELVRDMAAAAKQAKAFRKRYLGKIAGMGGKALGEAVAAYERIEEMLGRLLSYAQLVHAGDLSNPEIGKFFQTVRENATAVSSDLLFFTLELNAIDDDALPAKLKAPGLKRYGPWLRDVRAFRPHQVGEEMERLLNEKRVSGRGAWNRLFDETMAALRFPFDDKSLTSEEAFHLLSDADSDVRRKAAESVGGVLGENVRLFALITNTLAKDKEIEDSWRKFPAPASSRNLSNRVEDEVVEALVVAVKASYPALSHRYYALKARWFAKDRLAYWDRNAPLPEAEDRRVPWDEARETVLGAYAAFSPELAKIGRRFFDQAWIDAPVRPGKAGGAFAHPTVPGAHPYLLVNYQGKPRDVMTLAHELGHGVHQVLAAPQGQLLADTPLTLAETASVFGEMLTFRAMLKAETDPSRRKIMLSAKVEDMLNTVIHQIAFYDFELRVHSERREGELTADRLCEVWLDVQRESLGPALDLDGAYRFYWTYIPHFIHSPFYVYAYAFGDCLVNALYAVYEIAEEGFVERYLDMLRAGGTLRHKELLAPFGLDAADPEFWARGLGVIGDLVDQLETMG